MIVNVDTFVASTDQLPGMSPAQVGRKVAVMSLSDLAAKGVVPSALMLSLSVPSDYNLGDAVEIIRGASQYCLKNKVHLIGGDTGLASDVVVTGVALGLAHPDEIVKRSGAQPGDIVAVCGMFGLTSVAFKILLEDMQAPPKLTERALVAAYKPEIDLEIVHKLSSIEAVSSSMDSSDGLGVTLHTMSRHSGVRFEIDSIPAPPDVIEFAEHHGLDPVDLVFNGGEEFAVVLTIPANRWLDAVAVGRTGRFAVRRIGRVVEGEGVVLFHDGAYSPIPDVGYDSLRKWS